MFVKEPTGTGLKPHATFIQPFAYGFKGSDLLIAQPAWAPCLAFNDIKKIDEIQAELFWKDKPVGGFFFAEEMLEDIKDEWSRWEAEL